MILKHWRLAASAAALAAICFAHAEQPPATPTPGPEPLPPPAIAPTSERSCLKTYPVADIVVPYTPQRPDPSTAVDSSTMAGLLVKMIPQVIARGAWDVQGGDGAIDFHPLTLALVVRQTPEVHEQIAQFLQQLRSFQEKEEKTYRVQMRLVKSGATDCVENLPSVVVPDGKPAKVMIGPAPEERQAQSPAPGGFGVEVRVLALDKDRLGLSLDMQAALAHKKVDHLRAVREVKPGEAVKVTLSEAAKGVPPVWFEVLVSPMSKECEQPVKAADLPLAGMTLPSKCYLEHPPQYMPPEPQAVVPAAYKPAPQKMPSKPKATTTVKLSGPEGGELSVRTAGSRVVVKGEALEAWADHADYDKGGDGLILSGNVRVKYHKGDKQGRISANKLRIELRSGDVEIGLDEPMTSTKPACVPASSWGPCPMGSR
jgi:hypothetical protein